MMDAGMPNSRAICVVSNFWVSKNCKSAGFMSSGTYFSLLPSTLMSPAVPVAFHASFAFLAMSGVTLSSEDR